MQVAQSLRHDIESGTFPAGSTLPTEAALCDRFAVSRHTVREALRTLRADRLIESRQGAGTVVRPQHRSDQFILETASINDLVSYASNMWLTVHSVSMETISPDQSAVTGIPEGEEWLVVRGLAKVDGDMLPICWSEHFIRGCFAELRDVVASHHRPIFLLIEEMFGQEIVEITQDISAGIVPAALAGPLQVDPETAAIEVTREFLTAAGEVAQVTVHTHPASRFRYSTKIRRVRD